MGNALGPLHRRPLSRRRSRAALWAAVLPMGTAATAGAASLLAILLAVLVSMAAVSEAESERWVRDDSVGWAELDGFLPPDANLEQAVGKIRRARIVTSEYIGYSGHTSAVYEAYVRLGQVASEKQLRALVADDEPAVRVYAFRSLSNRQLGGVAYDVLLAHLDDNAWVRTQGGCIVGESTVFDAMLEYVEWRLSPAQVKEVRKLREPLKPPASATSPAGFFGRGR